MSLKLVRTILACLISTFTTLNAFAGYSWYTFSFVTDNGIEASGFFDLADGFTPSTTWQEITPGVGSFYGYFDANGNSGINSGLFSSLSVYNIPVTNGSAAYGIRFTVVPGQYTVTTGANAGEVVSQAITYTALDNKDLGTNEYVYSLTYKPVGTDGIPAKTSTDSEILSHTFTATMVPEIDGEKLPQVVLLIGGLFLAYRSRKFLNLASGGMAQPA